jgi:hypothetical protein
VGGEKGMRGSERVLAETIAGMYPNKAMACGPDPHHPPPLTVCGHQRKTLLNVRSCCSSPERQDAHKRVGSGWEWSVRARAGTSGRFNHIEAMTPTRTRSPHACASTHLFRYRSAYT